MSEKSTVLYRKHRPVKWNEVIGQEHIVNVLENSLKNNKIAHAYLFSGSRGTGKTTIARIFSKALGISDNDIYEIDAASNRGIDDIREIRDAVSVLPFESPYKVYIIDEVHMLTKEAFNALLKTLEEPPRHVIFMLATTETEKIPETVVSRCQVFSFKKPNKEILKSLINKVAKKEGYSLESGSADLIAILGDGSFRDTLGILQKIIGSIKGDRIQTKDVESITNAPKGSLVNDFIVAISHDNKDDAIASIMNAKEGNISMKLFISLIIEKIRIILLMKNAPKVSEKYKDQFSEDDWVLLEKIIADINAGKAKINSAMLLELLKVYEMTGKSYIDSLPLELMVMG